jgi:hypothetical protein
VGFLERALLCRLEEVTRGDAIIEANRTDLWPLTSPLIQFTLRSPVTRLADTFVAENRQ